MFRAAKGRERVGFPPLSSGIGVNGSVFLI